jgi:hypothetical protein
MVFGGSPVSVVHEVTMLKTVRLLKVGYKGTSTCVFAASPCREWSNAKDAESFFGIDRL